MKTIFAWSMVFATILFTVYGQLVIKWQVTTKYSPPAFAENWPFALSILLRPWIISAFVAAFAASLCWMVAMSRLELSRAYPFMALNFLIVCLVAVPLFGESFSATKAIGLLTVVIGLIIMSQA